MQSESSFLPTHSCLLTSVAKRCRNHNRECVWVESKRGRRPKSLNPDGTEQPSIGRRPSDSTISQHSTPERTHVPVPVPATVIPTQPMLAPPFVGTPARSNSFAPCNPPSSLRNERPEERPRDRLYEAAVSPLMEMIDGNESRQLLSSRIKLVERESTDDCDYGPRRVLISWTLWLMQK